MYRSCLHQRPFASFNGRVYPLAVSSISGADQSGITVERRVDWLPNSRHALVSIGAFMVTKTSPKKTVFSKSRFAFSVICEWECPSPKRLASAFNLSRAAGDYASLEHRFRPAAFSSSFTPVYRFGHLLLVPTQVGESSEMRLFAIDTGAPHNLFSMSAAREMSSVTWLLASGHPMPELTGGNGRATFEFSDPSGEVRREQSFHILRFRPTFVRHLLSMRQPFWCPLFFPVIALRVAIRLHSSASVFTKRRTTNEENGSVRDCWAEARKAQ